MGYNLFINGRYIINKSMKIIPKDRIRTTTKVPMINYLKAWRNADGQGDKGRRGERLGDEGRGNEG